MDYTQLVCNRSDCPALGSVEVNILDQDFRFCQHHYDELEPVLVAVDIKHAEPQVASAVSEMA